MNATIEDISSVQKRIKVECTPEEVKKTFVKILHDYKSRANIKGFRQGKAPLPMIKKMYGERVGYDAADELIKQFLFKAIDDHKLEPIARPVLETANSPKEGESYAFSVLVDIMPTITPQGYDAMKIEITEPFNEAKVLEFRLEEMRRGQASLQDADEGVAAADNHAITFDQSAVDEEGNEVAILKAESVKADLGKQQLIKEIEVGLVGMKKGEVKQHKMTFPSDFRHPDLAGKTFDLTLTMQSIEVVDLPELDDEFAKDFSKESLAELKESLQQEITWSKTKQLRELKESSICEQLRTQNAFEVPPTLVDRVIDGMIDQEFQNDQEHAKKLKADRAQRDSRREVAKLRAQNSMILVEIGKSRELQPDEEYTRDYIKRLLGPAGEGEEQKSFIEGMIGNFMKNRSEELLISRTFDFIIDKAEVNVLPAPQD